MRRSARRAPHVTSSLPHLAPPRPSPPRLPPRRREMIPPPHLDRPLPSPPNADSAGSRRPGTSGWIRGNSGTQTVHYRGSRVGEGEGAGFPRRGRGKAKAAEESHVSTASAGARKTSREFRVPSLSSPLAVGKKVRAVGATRRPACGPGACVPHLLSKSG